MSGLTATVLSAAEQPDYWLQLCPGMSISDLPFAKATSPYRIDDHARDQSVKNIIEEGYFRLPPTVLEEDCERLAEAIRNVTDAGFPAPFALIYDEFWQLFANLSEIAKPLLGSKIRISPGDLWAWNVGPSGSSQGWGPHRDLTDPDSLQPDGRPKHLTLWIPFTDATAMNGCMYVLPTHLDPNVPGNLKSRDIAPEQFQSIRALTVDAGAILGWNSRILHWGSKSTRYAKQARINVALYLMHDDGTLNYGVEMLPQQPVPFWYRVGAIAGAMRLFQDSPLSGELHYQPELVAFAKKFLDRLQG